MAVLVVAWLGACGTQSQNRARLTVATSWGQLAAATFQQELIAVAEELGAVDLELQVLGAQLLQELLLRQPAAPEETSVDLAVVPNEWLGRLAQRGMLAELPPSRVGALQQALVGQAILAVTEGDRVLAYPLSGEVLAFIYNPRFFSSPPRTIDEVVANPSLPAGVVPFAFDISSPQHVLPLAASLGHLTADETGVPFLDEAVLAELVQRLAPLWRDGRTWRLFRGADLESLHVQLFAEGRLASFIGGPWLLDALHSAGQPVAVLPIPPFTAGGSPGGTLVAYQCVAVSQQTPWLDLALEVGARLSTSEVNDRLNQAIRRLPVRVEAYRSHSFVHSPGIPGFLRALEEGRSLPASPPSLQRLRRLEERLASLALSSAPPSAAELKRLLAVEGAP